MAEGPLEVDLEDRLTTSPTPHEDLTARSRRRRNPGTTPPTDRLVIQMTEAVAEEVGAEAHLTEAEIVMIKRVLDIRDKLFFHRRTDSSGTGTGTRRERT